MRGEGEEKERGERTERENKIRRKNVTETRKKPGWKGGTRLLPKGGESPAKGSQRQVILDSKKPAERVAELLTC